VAVAALAGAPREQLLQAALKALRQDTRAERIGIWLEPDLSHVSENRSAGTFYGIAWDRSFQEHCPPEWKVFSLEPFLPGHLLEEGKPFEQDLPDSGGNPVIGQLLWLRRALWVPVATRNRVTGWILLGSRGRPLASSLEPAKATAAELALAIDAEDQLRTVRVQNGDLALARQILETGEKSSPFEASLATLLADCVVPSAAVDGAGAAFAAIGALRPPGAITSSSTIDFRWRAGDETWTSAVDTYPLAKVWRRAVESRRIIGSEAPAAWPQSDVVRVVALPLEADGQLLGVLVAGLSRQAMSLSTVERLELHARLAAFLIVRGQRQEEESRRAGVEQALLEFVTEPVFLLDDEGRIAAASRGARALLGNAGQPEALLSGPLSDLFCAPDRERLREWLRPALNSAAPAQDATRAELQNGLAVRLHLTNRLPGRVHAVSLLPEEGLEQKTPSGYGEGDLRSVLDWLEEGVVLFDARGHVRVMNSRFEQLAGLAPEESAKIRTLEDLIARLEGQAAEPERFAEHWRELARNVQGGVREELQMMRPAPRVLERATKPVLDALGRPAGRVEIYRDLTAQRLFHSKLLQTEKLAALGQMVSGVAHELSNPLTSILGYAQRLLAGQNSSGPGGDARQIYQEAERATGILRQLLLHARETVPERGLVSLNQIAMRATELQRFSLAAERIRVELDLDPALPFLHGDAGQMQQVLLNLLGNARQAMEGQGQGGVIRLRTRRASGRRVLLEVEDTGPGIPQAIQGRIFDPFFTTKPAGVGTGLGLSIVQAVVREHGGQVRVRNAPQGGALFQMEIPAASERQQEDALARLVREEKTVSAQPASVEPAPVVSSAHPRAAPAESTPAEPSLAKSAGAESRPTGSRKDARVLVVEDEPTVARLIGDVLADEGMRVDVMLDGREALDRAAHEEYDLVICDMKMPGLDGQKFYRSLEGSGDALRERFLFVTGDVLAAQTRDFLKKNKLPHVAKPFRVEELTEKVHAVLRRHPAGEPVAPVGSKKKVAKSG